MYLDQSGNPDRHDLSSASFNQSPTGKANQLTDQQLEDHIAVSQYGAFELTDAIRPSVDLQVMPKQGFRNDFYFDHASGIRVPCIMAAATKSRLFDLFFDLLDPLGDVVDVVLESSHYSELGYHIDKRREGIELPILKSILYEFEDLLMNDGCTGVAVFNPKRKLEVQFDEHKLFTTYCQPEVFKPIFISHDVYIDKSIKFITEGEHIHSSSAEYYSQFELLAARLATDGEGPVEEVGSC